MTIRNSGGTDGLCVNEVYIDYEPMNLATPKYIDACQEPNSCAYGEFQETLIIFRCQGWTGISDVSMIIGHETHVVDIPIDVVNLRMSLNAFVDIDLQL